MNDKVHLLSEGERVTELWGRVTPARFNDYEVHVNRVKGEYVWHAHRAGGHRPVRGLSPRPS
jgi:hypothetical protein